MLMNRTTMTTTVVRVLNSQYFSIINPKFRRFFCNNVSSSNVHLPLVNRLLQIPKWNIKSALDSDAEKFALESGGFMWDAVVTSLRTSSPERAQMVLEWRLERMLKMEERNHEQYSNLISLCGRLRNVPLAMQVFTSMEVHGLKPSSSVFNSLIHTCLCSNDALMAFSLFEIMENSESYKPNAETYDAFVSVLADLGNSDAAQRWFSAKKDAKFSGTLENFENLILVCIRSGDFDGADRFYEEMTSIGIMPGFTVLEDMLEGLCKQRNFIQVKKFVNYLLDVGYKLNSNLAQALVRLYSSCKNEEELEELLVALAESKQDPGVLSCVHCGIIRMYAGLDRLDDVEYSVGRMLKQGWLFKCADDVEKVISAYFRKEAFDRLDLFLEHIKCRYQLARSTYNLLIAGYRRAGMPEKVACLIKEMKSGGVL